MAEKKKFRIPTASEMEEESTASTSSVKAFSKFMTMKKTGEVSDACDLDSSVRCGVSTESREAKTQAIPSGSGTKAPGSLGKGTSVSKGISRITDKTFAQPACTSKESESVEPIQPIASTSSASNNKNANVIQEEIKFATLKPGKMNSIIVNARQRGNPILKHIRSIPWEYGDINPDYLLGQTTCALYLSLRYHQLNPNYIHERLKKLGKSYELRVLLVQVDIKEPHHLVKDLAKICILADCTLILAFSTEEAGRYLETYKIYESKPPDAIMEKTEKDYMSKMVDCLTSIKSVNKTDVMTLLSSFGSLEGVSNASEEEISLCPGFGPQKAKRVHDIFQEPFLKAKKLRKVYYHRKSNRKIRVAKPAPLLPKGKVVEFPEKYTTRPLQYRKTAGRDEKGHVIVGTRGGGHKQNYRWVDYVRKQGEDGKVLEERVEKILYDPIRTARLALVASGRHKRYVIATQNVKEGDVVSTSNEIPEVVVPAVEGNAHPLGALPVGCMVHHIEKLPGEGGKYCLAAGASAQMIKKKTDTCIIRLPSKQEIELDRHCIAVIGQVSNADQRDKHIGSAWRLRWLGFRPRSGQKTTKGGYDGRKIKKPKPVKLITRQEPEPKVYQMTLES